MKQFELDPTKSLKKSVRKVFNTELRAAIDALNEQPHGPEAAVHDFRKGMKRTRALLRLVRSELGSDYSECNRALRDAARLFSSVRDQDALLESLSRLEEHAEPNETESIFRLKDLLGGKQQSLSSETAFKDAVSEAQQQVNTAQQTFDSTRVKSTITLRRGLKKTLRRAKRLSRKAQRRDDETLHQLRKRVKYHRYHLRLLRPGFRPVLKAERKVAKRVSDMLGDDHDLAVLTQVLREDKVLEESLTKLAPLIRRRREELQSEALCLCALLFSEKPKHRSKRLVDYFTAH